ncbi:MAG: DUF4838 domain-containing protein [Phycisphaerae bacterium]
MLIAKEGKSTAAIVIDRKAPLPVKFAATELRKYLRRISGAVLPLTTVLSEPRGRTISIRTARIPAAKSEDAEAFTLAITEGQIRLVGNNPRSTVFAVYSFLEDYLGCRWLAPGTDGEEIPRFPTIDLPPQSKMYKPDLKFRGFMIGHREMTGKDIEDWIDWMAKNKLNYCNTLSWHWDAMGIAVQTKLISEIKKRDLIWDFGHCSFHYFISAHYRKGSQRANMREWFHRHPEQSALKNGLRLPPESEGQLCLSNPKVFATLVKNIKGFIKNHPQVDIITFMPNDAVGKWCECGSCRKLNARIPSPCGYSEHINHLPRPSFSTVYYRVSNKLAREIYRAFPEKRIRVRSYTDCTDKPDGVKLYKNVIQNTDFFWRDYGSILSDGDREQNNYFVATLRKWLKDQGPDRSQISEYYMGMYGNATLPWHLRYLLAKDIPYLVHLGAGGLTTQAEIHQVGTYGLNFYLFAKLAWNCGNDTERLFDDYCNQYYGAAGPAMRQYYLMLEKAMKQAKGYLSPSGLESFLKRFPDMKLIDRCRGYLKRALRSAEDARYSTRVQSSLTSLEYAGLFREGIDCRQRGEQALEHRRYTQAEQFFARGVTVGDQLLALTLAVKGKRVIQVDGKYPWNTVSLWFLDACRKGLYLSRLRYNPTLIL